MDALSARSSPAEYRNYLKNLSLADKTRYIAAEVSARNRDAGLWIDPNPTAPWMYRRSKR